MFFLFNLDTFWDINVFIFFPVVNPFWVTSLSFAWSWLAWRDRMSRERFCWTPCCLKWRGSSTTARRRWLVQKSHWTHTPIKCPKVQNSHWMHSYRLSKSLFEHPPIECPEVFSNSHTVPKSKKNHTKHTQCTHMLRHKHNLFFSSIFASQNFWKV